jgi:chromosome segregation ATPase
VYSKLIRQDSMLRLFVSLEKKKDEYIERSTSVAEFIKLQDYMKQFAKDQYIEVAKAQSDAEDKKLYNLQQELSLIENKKSKLLKSIESDKALIISEKDNIALQNNELQTVDAAIKEQAGGNAKSDQIKELDKRKKKVLNSIESSERKIAKASNAIDKANNEIPVNEQKQARVKEQVVQQEAVSFRYADKLRRIREY